MMNWLKQNWPGALLLGALLGFFVFVFLVIVPESVASKRQEKLDAVFGAASFDHGCPREKIQILKEEKAIAAFTLDVCGKVRRYRDAGGRWWFFVDVTDNPIPINVEV